MKRSPASQLAEGRSIGRRTRHFHSPTQLRQGRPQVAGAGGAAGGFKPIELVLKPFLSPPAAISWPIKRTNQLIIRDIPSVIPMIDNIIRQLDFKKSPQVEIDARIVAASRFSSRRTSALFNLAARSGKQPKIFAGWRTDYGHKPGGSYPTPVPFSSGTASPNQMPFLSNPFRPVAPTSGILRLEINNPSFALDVILTAAESKGAGKVLSRPKVVTQNNYKGTVKQGEQIPIQTTVNNTISTQYIDAVLELDVTPQITADGTISMVVHLENTAIDPGVPAHSGRSLALSTQSVDNQVVVRDGATVMLGGVMITQQNNQINQVPLLGSIPIIGNLFKEHSVKISSSELLFFLTPHVVDNYRNRLIQSKIE